MSKKEVLEAISKMSVIEVVELIADMEEKFGVSAAAPVAVAVAGGDAGGSEAAEQTEFNVMLTNFGENKVSVIKAVRASTGLGLKEAKTLVESAPIAVKEGLNKADADQLKKTLEEAGASIEVK